MLASLLIVWRFLDQQQNVDPGTAPPVAVLWSLGLLRCNNLQRRIVVGLRMAAALSLFQAALPYTWRLWEGEAYRQAYWLAHLTMLSAYAFAFVGFRFRKLTFEKSGRPSSQP